MIYVLCGMIASGKSTYCRNISNSYSPLSKEIYTNLYNTKVFKIKASRTISAKTDKRKPVNEIIAVFKK